MVVLVLSRLGLMSTGMNVYVCTYMYAMTISQLRASTYLVLTMPTDIHVLDYCIRKKILPGEVLPPALIGENFIMLNYCPVLKIAGDLYCI